MTKSSKHLEKLLTDFLTANIGKRKLLQSWIKKAEERYGIPELIISDYILLRRNMIDTNAFLLFIITDITQKPSVLNEYFSPQEINTYSKEKWVVEKAEFPLTFDMMKINEEQFVGRISVKELMKLRDAQLINYNENTQRTMKHIVKGDEEYYQISINKDAVYAIMESFESDLYIPNTITLNIPEDAVYKYNEKNHQLIIRQASYLDILDGYHRYVAMSKVCARNREFDYEMELRIVRFPVDKARRFIWQEDQKTKMRKIDSDSMNSAKISNMIVDRLNTTSSFVFSGKISRNKGIINAAYLSNAIELILLKGEKEDERVLLKTKTKDLIEAMEELTDIDPNMIKTPWDKKAIFTMVFDLKYGTMQDVPKDYLTIMNDDSICTQSSYKQSDVTRARKLLGR